MSGKRYAFVIDLKRCIGCDTCAVACKMENEVPLGQFRLNVFDAQHNPQAEIPTGRYPNLDQYWVPSMCQHCENAPCVQACPTEALYTDLAEGMVRLDKSKCIGCGRCGEACPYDAISFDPVHGTADKCTMCDHRVKENLDPMCVVVCPTRAMYFGDLNEADSKVSELVGSREHKVLNEAAGALPKIFYLEP